MTAVFAPNSFYRADNVNAVGNDPSYRIADDQSSAIHLTWLIRGFEHAVNYASTHNHDTVSMWCIEHAGINQFLINRDAKNVLFKSREVATMYKLVQSE